MHAPFNALDLLPGTWHLQATSFPMWLKGDKLDPTFTYTPAGEGRLLDEVRYRHADSGKPGAIVGYDRVQGDGSRFVWRGKGLLFIARSQWSVVHVAPSGDFAIIRFEKTLFTPSGVDVITRSPTVDAVLRAELDAALTQYLHPDDESLTWL